jgi:hypothetical protein
MEDTGQCKQTTLRGLRERCQVTEELEDMIDALVMTGNAAFLQQYRDRLERESDGSDLKCDIAGYITAALHEIGVE